MGVTLVALCISQCTGAVPTLAGAGLASHTLIVNASRAQEQVGQLVVVQGIAQDAKLAAAVVAGDLVVYCLGVETWPTAVVGTQVTARGTLEHTDEFAARAGPHGEVSAGTGGPVYVLRQCTYEASP